MNRPDAPRPSPVERSIAEPQSPATEAGTPLAIVGALHEELRALLPLLAPPHRSVRMAGRDFHLGTLHGEPAVLVLSGVGKVAAATTAVLLLQAFAARAIVFCGVAGGLAEGVAVGDVVVADRLLQHDLDASPLSRGSRCR